MKIKNNLASSLSIAGIGTILPGAAIPVDVKSLSVARSAPSVRQLEKAGAFTVEGEKASPATGDDEERAALIEEAKSLGVKGVLAKMKDETLREKIEEAKNASPITLPPGVSQNA